MALLRHEPHKPLQYIERALELDPNYEAAKHDKNTALEMLKPKQARSPTP